MFVIVDIIKVFIL